MILQTRVPFEERARFMLNSMCPYPDSPEFAAALREHADFDAAAGHYAWVCQILQTLTELHPPREKANWGPDSTFASAEAAALVRQAGEAERKGVSALQGIVGAL